jgi:hypothetical protein
LNTEDFAVFPSLRSCTSQRPCERDPIARGDVAPYSAGVSTLAEIEKAVLQFSAEELAELEQFIRRARREKASAGKSSLRDLEAVSVGRILQPLGPRDEWYE